MMNMLGMPMSGVHSGPNLLPEWLGMTWAMIFAAVAASHLRHMLRTAGQRRSWHACHVLMAVGMAFMYVPARIDPFTVSTAFWQLTFASAGLIAAGWAIGGSGRVSTLIWLLTSIDLGAMLYMWAGSAQGNTAPVTWLLGGYVITEGAMWALDLYRRLDGATPIVSWRLLAVESGATLSAASIGSEAAATGSLLGELDISASMIAMTLGMAYMLVAAQLMG